MIGVAALIGFLLLHHIGAGARGSGAAVATGSTTTTSLFQFGNGVTGSTTNTTVRTSTPSTNTVALRAAQDIKVLVANGTSKPGLAGHVSDLVHAKGYVTLTSTNSTLKPPATIIFFQPSYSGDAAAMATKLGLPAGAVQAMAQPPPVANLSGANILVVVGPDLATTANTTSTT